MKIIGIKPTHDAAVTLIEDGQLKFSVELEKLDNAPRYTAMHSLAAIDRVLSDFDVDPDTVDAWVLDGWKGGVVRTPARLQVAPYHEWDGPIWAPLLRPESFSEGLFVGGKRRPYNSYRHVAGHIVGAWAMSPWAGTRRACAAITWDGGQEPRVHLLIPSAGGCAPTDITFTGTLHCLYGIIYGIMGYYFGPYAKAPVRRIDIASHPEPLFGGYDVPGKLMSYIALGAPQEALINVLYKEYAAIEAEEYALSLQERLSYRQTGINEHRLCRALAREVDARPETISGADALASMHEFLERLLVERARQLIPRGLPLIFSGGSALNIKWNSALRDCGHFADVFVSPFPNDAGSSFGAAACEWVSRNGWGDLLEFSVYAGPRMPAPPVANPPAGWGARRLDARQLGELLADNPDKVSVVLHGQAEIGPRALGHRSLFGHPGSIHMKHVLNAAKRREDFRPVAPICLEDAAPELFMPGRPDPWMLFDHHVRPHWADRIPAVVHLDGTARLQTINREVCPVTWDILDAFRAKTGLPLLCNTSANLNGSGFFPDVRSACEWADHAGPSVAWVWCEGFLFERTTEIGA